MPQALEMVLTNRVEEIPRLAIAVDAWFTEAGLAPERSFQLNLALDELLTNTILYGFAAGTRHEILVRISIDRGTLTAEIIDDALPFDPLHEAPAPSLDASVEDRPIGGLGVHLVKTLMDECSYRHDGVHNHLTLKQRVA